MHTSGFTHAPLSKYLVLTLVCSALLVTGTDTKHYLHLQPSLHLWKYRQWWRLLTWPLVYTNSTEVLFAVVTLYQIRVVERMWGTRKMASFLFSVLPYTTLLPPLLLTLLRPLSFHTLTFLPAGPTALIFALLAQYHAAVPYTYRYRVASSSSSFPTSTSTSTTLQPQTTPPTTSPASAPPTDSTSLELTSKSSSYLPALQLALSQLPGSLLPAAVGWAVGYAWRLDLLPFPSARWRVPEWVVGGGRLFGSASGRRRRGEMGRSGTGGNGTEGAMGEASGVGGRGGEGRRRG